MTALSPGVPSRAAFGVFEILAFAAPEVESTPIPSAGCDGCGGDLSTNVSSIKDELADGAPVSGIVSSDKPAATESSRL